MANIGQDRTGRWRRAAWLAGILAVCYFLFWRSSPMPDPFFHKVVTRDLVYSGTWEESFRVDRAVSRFFVETYGEGSVSAVRYDLDGGRDGGKRIWLRRDSPIGKGSSRFECGRDLPPGVYTVRFREDGFLGRYAIDVGSRHGATWWQKLLLLLVSVSLISGIVYVQQKLRRAAGKRAPMLAPARVALAMFPLPLFVMFWYLLFHEGGHALASICFGNFELGRSDFFGLGGLPHSGIDPGHHLEPWQEAVQSIAGPLLPSLAAWVVFAVWRTRWASRIRSGRFLLDLYWTFGLFALLGAHFGMLIAITGVRRDSDYRGFVNNISFEPWKADAFLLVLLAVNAWMLYFVVPHFWRLRRRIKSELGSARSEGGQSDVSAPGVSASN